MARLRFGPSIKKARVRLGITQAGLGEKLDPPVTQATIWQWESEKSSPNSQQKSQVRQILGKISNEIEGHDVDPEEKEDVIEAPSAIGAWLSIPSWARVLSARTRIKIWPVSSFDI